ncbi:hypothetical protein ACS0Y3_10580 [Burkholderia gladioli]|uniref:hypothetical protein n=1 Tax=Burkholderia gladioli TaxID=28095 RepID=UPI003F7AC476
MSAKILLHSIPRSTMFDCAWQRFRPARRSGRAAASGHAVEDPDHRAQSLHLSTCVGVDEGQGEWMHHLAHAHLEEMVAGPFQSKGRRLGIIGFINVLPRDHPGQQLLAFAVDIEPE